jgi:hypothetical protein
MNCYCKHHCCFPEVQYGIDSWQCFGIHNMGFAFT